MVRGPNRDPAMNGDPSSVGTPTTAMSASSASISVHIRDRRNDGIPTNGRSARCFGFALLMDAFRCEHLLEPSRRESRDRTNAAFNSAFQMRQDHIFPE